ncbi:MAG: D-ribitol-5-phosphate cytidylyltransferase [Oscillospiraceae bacterium]|nr:D-ribitol-5-phosphate cytidylyltransferase [Oscillospiraceae bacterium]MBR3474595.1 D-ribitol-5-phosphate cytidylyltransferase [Oscillospiraceae bacterium]
MIYAAVLAGGIGRRVERYTIPKQFVAIGGTPIIILTLREFLRNTRFKKIYVAIHPDWKDYLSEMLKASFSAEELDRISTVNGGKERLISFTNVMDAVLEEHGLHSEDVLICHDSVRPFVTQQMLNDCIDATLEDHFALTVVPTTDTIHVAHNDKFIDGTLDRNGLYNGQNPSGFNIVMLKRALESFPEETKASVTGTTQLILKLGYKIRIVKGHTSNFKITTDNDLDVAERIIRARPRTRKMELVDVTLRDGGIVVNFDFGQERMQKIKSTLEDSGVDYIETGYIDERKGSPEGRTCFDNELSIEKTLLQSGKKPGVTYLAMIDYGAFDVNRLRPRNPAGIDGIRLAFHKENWKVSVEWGKTILSKGYDLYIQPMVCMRYTDDEYKNLIRVCNSELADAKAFYIVDSFGQMDNMALVHKLEIADQYVSMSMKLGFHAHNNRQMAYSNALTFVDYNARHDLMLDASIMGMGKGAGNLCTELIEANLIQQGREYRSNVLYEAISEYFADQQKKTPWGYSLDYYLASLYSCTPSYIKIFTKDERVTTDVLIDLLKNMPDEKRAACDRAFAAEYLRGYFA